MPRSVHVYRYRDRRSGSDRPRRYQRRRWRGPHKPPTLTIREANKRWRAALRKLGSAQAAKSHQHAVIESLRREVRQLRAALILKWVKQEGLHNLLCKRPKRRK